MQNVSLFDAKTHLSRIVEDIVEDKQDAVVISRRGRPVVRMTRVCRTNVSRRIGIARGQFEVPDHIDGANPAAAALFTGRRRQRPSGSCWTPMWPCGR